MRKGFSLVTVIILILFIGMISALVLDLSGKTIGATKMSFKREQAILLAKSYTEMAIMAATSTNCMKKIEAEEKGYKINVRVVYIGNEVKADCSDVYTSGWDIKHTPSEGVVIAIETEVTYRDARLAGQQMRYFRRTVQKL